MPLLDPYQPSLSQPWNARRVAHLYNRLGFGATLAEIKAGLQMSPGQLVDKLLNEALALPSPPDPVWSNWTYSDYLLADPVDVNVPIGNHRNELYRRWIGEMTSPATAARAKIALALSNILVTGVNEYQSPPFQFHYYKLLHDFALGNYKELVLRMAKSPAMLVYLNGNISVASEPNENYARELMELFTMGENNGYTQADIVEMARALTGWRCDEGDWLFPYFDPTRWDDQPKTVFGVTGNFNFKQAHDLIFEFRKSEIAAFIPKKIYEAFVYPVDNQAVIAEMSATFQQHYWELEPMLRQLFKSQHFFSNEMMAVRIKSPLDALLGLVRTSGVPIPDWTTGDYHYNDIAYWASELNQEIFQPPNVAGWPGGHAWLNENTLTYRWTFTNYVMGWLFSEDSWREVFRELARELSNNSDNPYLITTALVEHFLRQDLEPGQLEGAIATFKDGYPENYYQDGTWNLNLDYVPFQVGNLFNYLMRLPEFQLN